MHTRLKMPFLGGPTVPVQHFPNVYILHLAMHYAICKQDLFSLRPKLGPSQKSCNMRIMQYYHMHYENVYCNLNCRSPQIH